MMTRDHYIIGRKIGSIMMDKTLSIKRKLFVFGCIQPDLNPLTYLKGNLSFQKLQGHNYQNATKLIQCYIKKLSKEDNLSLVSYYKLGKLIHYLADAFTFPHNEEFNGSVKEHVRYEKDLHQELLSSDKLDHIVLEPTYDEQMPVDLYQKFQKHHDLYRMERENVKDDLSFICDICPLISSSILKVAMESGMDTETNFANSLV